MALRVKICGITQAEQGRMIVQLGATALGFICVPNTPRYVAPEQIRAIVAELPMECDRVGVFLNHSIETICQIAKDANLTAVQLHGSESPEFCQAVHAALPHVELIKALRVRSPEALKQTTAYLGAIDALLLDAYHPHLPGGTGKTLDWQKLQQFQPDCPWFLSGGLTPENVQVALNWLTPQGIDVSSGVERSPGDKDLDKVAQLFARLAPLV